MVDDQDSRLLEEWKQARDVLKTFDDRIHDLRKYGFSFVTGLMTVEGLLLPWTPPSAATSATGIPDEAKFGVLIATTLLIIVLRWFDGNYQGFTYGAAVRAIVIERFLNLELSDQIQIRYEAQKLWLPMIILYVGFEVAVIGLAVALLPDHPYWIYYLILGTADEAIFYYMLANPQKRRWSHGGTDWSLDRLQCKRYDHIRIMVTNLNPSKKYTISWNPGTVAWNIVDKDGQDAIPLQDGIHPGVVHPGIVRRQRIEVSPGFSHVWVWRADVPPGIYRIIVNFQRSDKFFNQAKDRREIARKLCITS